MVPLHGVWHLKCSCAYFERVGVVCSHILAVNQHDVHYEDVAFRWRKACHGGALDSFLLTSPKPPQLRVAFDAHPQLVCPPAPPSPVLDPIPNGIDATSPERVHQPQDQSILSPVCPYASSGSLWSQAHEMFKIAQAHRNAEGLRDLILTLSDYHQKQLAKNRGDINGGCRMYDLPCEAPKGPHTCQRKRGSHETFKDKQQRTKTKVPKTIHPDGSPSRSELQPPLGSHVLCQMHKGKMVCRYVSPTSSPEKVRS